MKHTFALLGLLLFSFHALAQELPVVEESAESVAETPLTEEQQYQLWASEFDASLNRQTGVINLPGNKIQLDVPDGFYYLSPQDTKRVLEEAWGNPEGELTLGMLFPVQYSPFDYASWGVTLEYIEEGYIEDDDADDINYDELLVDMKKDTAEASLARQEIGYEAIELIGWAAQPYYDQATHKLYWAKEIKFGDAEQNTLNYNVRVLGRQGMLLMNFIASMDQLPEIEASRDEVLALAEFRSGHTYDDFNPDIDEYAAYGLGGVIAGKALAKTGAIAALLIFLKKFWFVLLLPFIWLYKRVTGKKSEAS